MDTGVTHGGPEDGDYAPPGSEKNGYSWSPCDKPKKYLLCQARQIWREQTKPEDRSRSAEAALLVKIRAELKGLSRAVLVARCRAAEAKRLAAFDQDICLRSLDAMQSKFAADVERWGSMSTWSVREAVALYLDRDPDCFRWSAVKRHVPSSAALARCKAFRRLAKDAVRDRVLHPRTAPHAFIQWADLAGQGGFRFPDRLVAVVTLHDAGEKVPERLPAHEIWKDMTTKERNNVFRLLLALAAHGYGFNPYSAYGTGATAMSKAIEAVGLKLDHQTISTMLRRLKEEVDPNVVKRCIANRSAEKSAQGQDAPTPA